MKRLLLISIFALVTLSIFAQPVKYDTVRMGRLVTDTCIFIPAKIGRLCTIEFDYTTLNANNAKVQVGYSLIGNTFNWAFEHVLNVTADKVVVNGKYPGKALILTAQATWMTSIKEEAAIYFVIKVYKGSVTSGNLCYSYKQL